MLDVGIVPFHQVKANKGGGGKGYPPKGGINLFPKGDGFAI